MALENHHDGQRLPPLAWERRRRSCPQQGVQLRRLCGTFRGRAPAPAGFSSQELGSLGQTDVETLSRASISFPSFPAPAAAVFQHSASAPLARGRVWLGSARGVGSARAVMPESPRARTHGGGGHVGGRL